jgi:hypothetical protein
MWIKLFPFVSVCVNVPPGTETRSVEVIGVGIFVAVFIGVAGVVGDAFFLQLNAIMNTTRINIEIKNFFMYVPFDYQFL